jgi:hypothetical protein
MNRVVVGATHLVLTVFGEALSFPTSGGVASDSLVDHPGLRA